MIKVIIGENVKFINYYDEKLKLSEHSILEKNWMDNVIFITTNDIFIYTKMYSDIFINENKINDKSKIYFSKNCNIPALLISKLNLNISRCINLDKTDYIICDKSELKLYTSYYYLFIEDDLSIYGLSYNNISNLLKTYKILITKGILKEKIYFGFEKSNSYKDHKMLPLLNHYNKIIFSQDFNTYLNDHLPKISSEEIDNIYSMLQSSDEESYKAGINLLQYYNIEEFKLPILIFLIKHLHYCTNYSSLSKIEKFIILKLNISKYEFSSIMDTYKYNKCAELVIYNFLKTHKSNLLLNYASDELKNKYFKDVIINNICSNQEIKYYLSVLNLKVDLIPASEEFSISDLYKDDTDENIKILIKFIYDLIQLTAKQDLINCSFNLKLYYDEN